MQSRNARPKRRRWTQFSLASLLLFVLLCAVVLSAWKTYVEPYAARKRAIDRLERVGAVVEGKWVKAPKLVEWTLGDDLIILPEKVIFRQGISDAQLAALEKDLRSLPGVNCVGVDGGTLTDAGLPYLDLPELDTLVVGYTRVEGSGLKQMSRWKELRYLCMDGTPLTDASLADLGEMRKLHRLSLASTAITDEGLGHLRGLTLLEALDLRKTKVTDAGLKHLAGMVRLRKLDLRRTAVTGSGFAFLTGLHGLYFVELRDTEVNDAGLAYLKKLPGLERLYLNGTRVTDAGMMHLDQIPRLVLLELRGCDISDAGLARLKNVPSSHLGLRETQVTEAGLEQYRKSRPTVGVYPRAGEKTTVGVYPRAGEKKGAAATTTDRYLFFRAIGGVFRQARWAQTDDLPEKEYGHASSLRGLVIHNALAKLIGTSAASVFHRPVSRVSVQTRGGPDAI